jgi:membrane protein DedA with SNARE-associated domain
MVAETVFPPIPSEVVLPLAGFLVEQGEFEFVPALIAATTGSLVGAVLLEEAARRGGRPFAERFAVKFAHQDAAKLDEAERWFQRRGPLIVLVGRCIPGVRSLVALPAGVLRMPRGQYIVLTLIGSTVWNTLLIGAGYLLGTQWEHVEDVIGSLSGPLLALTAIAVAAALAWRRRHA